MENLYLKCHQKLMELSWHVIKKSRCNLADLGFAWNQYSLMKALKPGESLTISEISSRVNRKCSNVTPIVDFLVSKGIVERITDDRDRRVIRVMLTKDGETARKETINKHEAFINELYGDLDQKDMEDFIHIIDVLIPKVVK